MPKETQDFEEAVKSKEKLFVLFYATWCPHSRAFLPIFQAYAKTNPNECLSIIVDDKPDLCDKYEVDYFPTVVLFKEGKIHKRLDPEPGGDLTKKQLADLAKSQ